MTGKHWFIVVGLVLAVGVGVGAKMGLIPPRHGLEGTRRPSLRLTRK